MPNFILLTSFIAAQFLGAFLALHTDSLLCVAGALLVACVCGAAGSRLSYIADQRQTLRDIRAGRITLVR
jgi:1,4-dihydroxy-2-naphthoate octaprenyltransferase